MPSKSSKLGRNSNPSEIGRQISTGKAEKTETKGREATKETENEREKERDIDMDVDPDSPRASLAEPDRDGEDEEREDREEREEREDREIEAERDGETERETETETETAGESAPKRRKLDDVLHLVFTKKKKPKAKAKAKAASKSKRKTAKASVLPFPKKNFFICGISVAVLTASSHFFSLPSSFRPNFAQISQFYGVSLSRASRVL